VRIVGAVGDKSDEGPAMAPWLGRFEDLRSVLDRHDVDLIFVALTHAEYGRLAAVLTDIGDDQVDIHLVPDLHGLTSLRGGVEEFEGVPLIHLRESPLQRSEERRVGKEGRSRWAPDQSKQKREYRKRNSRAEVI